MQNKYTFNVKNNLGFYKVNHYVMSKNPVAKELRTRKYRPKKW